MLAYHLYVVDGKTDRHIQPMLGPRCLYFKPNSVGIKLNFSSVVYMLLQALICMISQAVSNCVIKSGGVEVKATRKWTRIQELKIKQNENGCAYLEEIQRQQEKHYCNFLVETMLYYDNDL